MYGKATLKSSELALAGARLKPETLTAALAAASTGDYRNAEIAELLKNAGAEPPVDVDAETLQSYAGEYESEQGLKVDVSVKHGTLIVTLGGQHPLSLIAVDKTTFRPAALEGGTVTFNVEANKTTGLSFRQGSTTTQLRRAEDTSRE